VQAKRIINPDQRMPPDKLAHVFTRIGAPRAQEVVQRVPFGYLLPPKKRGREAFGYIPNSFGSEILRTSPLEHAGWAESAMPSLRRPRRAITVGKRRPLILDSKGA